MGRIFRVFIQPAQVGDTVDLAVEEARHLYKVLRCQAGECVEGFDGRGGVYRLEILTLGPADATARILERDRDQGGAAVPLILGQALIKPDAMEWVIQKATELGVERFQPLVSRFVDRREPRQYIEARLTRWERIVRESLKQSGRNVRMEVLPPVDALDFMCGGEEACRLIPHPYARLSLQESLAPLKRPVSAVRLAIGPEGGWAEDEVAAAVRGGFTVFRLGPHVMRADTAAVATVAILMSRFGWE